MYINSSRQPSFPSGPSRQRLSVSSLTPIQDSVELGGGPSPTTVTKRMKIAALTTAGALVGGVPLLGGTSNGISVFANFNDSPIGAIAGGAGAVANVAATFAMGSGTYWPIAISSALGGLSWGCYAYNEVHNSFQGYYDY